MIGDIIIVLTIIFAVILNYYSYNFIKPEYEKNELNKLGIFVSGKYFTKKGWRLHVIAIILGFLGLILAILWV